MAEHALLSASGSERWIQCQPSARLEEAVDEETSEYAKEGSFAHSLAETYLAHHLGLALRQADTIPDSSASCKPIFSAPMDFRAPTLP
jgi:hypothetical protein